MDRKAGLSWEELLLGRKRHESVGAKGRVDNTGKRAASAEEGRGWMQV